MTPIDRSQRGFSVHPQWHDVMAQVRIVLVGMTHPGNIGSVSRVMKNMGLRNLTLVSSTDCGPSTDAFAMASGSYGIVEQARRTDNLRDALNDCLMSVGTSARIGRKRIAASAPDEVIPELLERAKEGPVACVFGRESKGLSNEEMRLCTHHMVVPTDMEFASMNVAHACVVTAYEIFKRTCLPTGFKAAPFIPASVGVREEMYDHIEQVLVRAGFLDESNPLHMMRDLRRILNSAKMDERDVRIIRGVFRKIGNMVRIADTKVKTLERKLQGS